MLEKFGKGNSVKFDIEGNTLVSYLYDEGIRHAVRRATPKKLAALQKADELFACTSLKTMPTEKQATMSAWIIGITFIRRLL